MRRSAAARPGLRVLPVDRVLEELALRHRRQAGMDHPMADKIGLVVRRAHDAHQALPQIRGLLAEGGESAAPVAAPQEISEPWHRALPAWRASPALRSPSAAGCATRARPCGRRRTPSTRRAA